MAPEYFFVNVVGIQDFSDAAWITEDPDFLFCTKEELFEYVMDATFEDSDYGFVSHCPEIYGIGADGEICAEYVFLEGQGALGKYEFTEMTVDKMIEMEC
jgi:hypothetical protein